MMEESLQFTSCVNAEMLVAEDVVVHGGQDVVHGDRLMVPVRLAEPHIYLLTQMVCGARLGLPDLVDHCDCVVRFEEIRTLLPQILMVAHAVARVIACPNSESAAIMCRQKGCRQQVTYLRIAIGSPLCQATHSPRIIMRRSFCVIGSAMSSSERGFRRRYWCATWKGRAQFAKRFIE
jgi:hypothetical protein